MQNNNQNNNAPIALDLDHLEDEQQQLFLEEVGTVVFQSALMKYLAVETEEVASEFETFINLQVGSPDFIESLCLKYPSFGEALNEEITAFTAEINSLA